MPPDQVSPEGAPAPDANASQAKPTTDVVTAKPGSEAGSSPAATEPSDKPSKPEKDGRDVRIDELTRRLREAERRNERLLRVAEDRGRQPSAQPQQPTASPTGDPTRPQPPPVDARQIAAQLREEELTALRRERFEERQSKFAQKTKDFYEVTDPGSDPDQARWPCSQAMAEVIEDSEEGPALMYYLAQNPDEARKYLRLTPTQAGRELGRLEDRLVSERKKATEKPVSQAPPPPPKVEGSDEGTVERDPKAMTQKQFNKWREGFISKRR